MRLWLSIFFLVLVVSHAFLRGGWPERYAAATFIISFAVELLSVRLFGLTDYTSGNLLRFAIDGVVFGCILLIALRANRCWPMWTGGLLLIVVSGHISAFLGVRAIAGVYWGMTVLPYYPAYLSLLLGTIWHLRRMAKFGPYPDWSSKIR